MSLFDDGNPDPRDRPRDPAGTQPKVDPDSLHLREYRYAPSEAQVDGELEEAIGRLDELDDAEPGRTGVPVPMAQSPRFQFLWGALLAVGVIAIAGVVVALVKGGDDDSTPKVAWSAWAPTSADAIGEIAAHVGPEYRAGKQQLALVTGGPLVFDNQAATPVVKDPATGNVAQVPGATAMYTLCGTGALCAFAPKLTGDASYTRGMLVRREALELALYTLHYVTQAENVAVLLPIAKGATTTTTLFFTRHSLAPQLAAPVTASLSATTPTLATIKQSPDYDSVGAVTFDALFDASFETSSVIPPVLVMAPHGG
jgi:hypothetical protein